MKIYFSIVGLLFGSSLVFYRLSPYFSALGLAIVSISSCFILLQIGMGFLALILLLVYMGGMLVVFVYSRALRTDRFPIVRNIEEIFIFRFFVIFWTSFLLKKYNWDKVKISLKLSKSIDIEGAAYLFHPTMLLFFILAAYILLITLIAILDITRGVESSTLRAL